MDPTLQYIKELTASIIILILALPAVPTLIAYMLYKLIGLSGFRRLFSYLPKESFMHSLHPVTKLIMVISITVSAALFTVNTVVDVFILAGLLLITLPFWYLAKPTEDRVRLIIILILTQWLLVAWGQSFLNPGFTRGVGMHRIYIFPRMLHWMAYSVTEEGFLYGFIQGIRIAASASAALLFITTTHPSEIIYGLRKFKFPIEITFMISVTLRSIPLLIEKSFIVLNAERARGLELFPRGAKSLVGNIKAVIKIFKALALAFFPILVESIRSARQLAIAATVKGFRAYKDRTYYKEIPFRKMDIIVAVFFVAMLLFFMYYQGLFSFF